MELIKELPDVFEEFAEQRQQSFLGIKELKDRGRADCRHILYIFSTGNRDGNGSSYSESLLHIRRDDSGG